MLRFCLSVCCKAPEEFQLARAGEGVGSLLWSWLCWMTVNIKTVVSLSLCTFSMETGSCKLPCSEGC